MTLRECQRLYVNDSSLTSGSMDKVNMMAIPVQSSVQKIIDGECDRSGMSKREMVKRLLEWFAAQDEAVRGSILGVLPPSMALDVAKLDPARLKGKR